MNEQMPVTLLLIEDNEQTARMVEKVLTPHGYCVRHANTGLAGLQLAREIRPHLILLDMDLPDLSGKIIANQLRGYVSLDKKMPIVAFTAESGVRARRLALAFGCDEFISKPIDTRAFPDQIAFILKTAYGEGQQS